MKKVEQQAWLHGGIGLVIGLLIATAVANITINNHHRSFSRRMDQHMGMSDRSKSHRDMSMSDMSANLQDKTGDEFDEAFIEMMIAHHQGAVEMAELARTRAKHDEIKTLADNIITAQLKEISDMYSWQKAWGYTSDDMMMRGNH
jgi:uncharacterized protein (DUF305 family)